MSTKSPPCIALLASFHLLFNTSLFGERWSVDGPNLNNRISLTLDEGKLSYEVNHQHTAANWNVEASGFKPLIQPSKMGVMTKQYDLSKHLVFLDASPVTSFSETYTMLTGKQRLLDNHYRERRIRFQTKDAQVIAIRLRAYAEGVAFRYEFEGTQQELTVTHELTEFAVGTSGTAWIMPYSAVATWSPGYEEDYQNAIPIGTQAPDTVGWAFPALFELPEAWVLITESGMDGDYFASHLQPNSIGGAYQIRLPEPDETYGVYPQESTASLPFQSPWRVIMIGRDQGAILGNNLVFHLAEPCAIEETSWIQPGPATWSWLHDKSSQTDYDRFIPFIDLAAELGWPYSLVDADWHLMKNGTILEANAYAKSKGVGLTLWYNSGGQHNLVKPIGPADRMHDPIARKAEMKWMQQHGFKGMKVDFMQSDKQGLIQLYIDILSDAADHELMVDFHGCTLPRGWERTWPNLMTMEAVKGGEQLWSQDFANKSPMLNTILPFTRNVVGSMDYTPFSFSGVENAVTTVTSHAHELATTVIFESGWQHVSESVENFEALPYYVWSFLSDLPTTWDETQWISGRPGEQAILARRKGDTWYVAGITASAKAQAIEVPTDFLIDNQIYKANLIADGTDRTEWSRTLSEHRRGETIQVTLLPNGGFIVVLEEKI